MKEAIKAWRYRNDIAILEIDDRLIRCLELRKQRSKIKYVQALEWRPNRREAAVSNGFIGPQVLELAARKFNLEDKNIVLRLPERHFRSHFVKLSADFDGNVDDWIRMNSSKILPPGLSKQQIAYGYHIFLNSQHPDTMLVTIAKRDMIANWIQAFRDSQLTLVGLTGDVHPVLNTFAVMDPEFYQQNQAFVHVGEDRITLMLSHKGDVVEFKEMFLPSGSRAESGNGADTEWSSMLEDELRPDNDQVAIEKVTLTGSEMVPNRLAHLCTKPGENFLESILPGKKMRQFALPFGLALQNFYAEFASVDLLTEDCREELATRRAQIETLNFAGLTVLVLLCTWLPIVAVNAYVKGELLGWQKQMARLQDQIAEIGQLRTRREKLSADLSLKQGIISRRSQLSKTFFRIAEITPADVWLRTIRYGEMRKPGSEKNQKQGMPVVLEGLSLTVLGPAALLSRFEGLSGFSGARLDLQQSIPADVVLKKTKLRKVPLYKFRLHAWKNASG